VPLKTRLQEQEKKTKAPWDKIEQDYVLSWILEGITLVPELNQRLVFKGGTCLRKCYFGNYRFSEDLDFSAKDGSIIEALPSLMNNACELAMAKIQSSGENVIFRCDPYVEKRPHPEGQQAFVIQARLPWHRDFYTKVYAEISVSELILLPPIPSKIIHPYGENLDGFVQTYPLEEVFAEKIRALLQFAKKLHERGWGRSRVRDYYDLWKILTTYGTSLNLNLVPSLVQKKCDHKGVVFNGLDDVFQEKLLLNVEKEWEIWLADIVPDLPNKDRVLGDLKIGLADVFNKEKVAV
jgi:predicted nucleotidyltransferase component of viral defense system